MGIKVVRPFPPATLLDPENWHNLFVPAHDVRPWVDATIFNEASALYNADHAHLANASISFLWAGIPNKRQTKRVVGQCEEVIFRCGAWQKGRQEQQMAEWFGSVPDYLITLDAQYAADCSDLAWCALIEHEMYHIAQALDDFGAPAFTKAGLPKLTIQSHDVEEFVGIVRRYGAAAGAGKTAELIAAAGNRPEVGELNISQACGTCLKAA